MLTDLKISACLKPFKRQCVVKIKKLKLNIKQFKQPCILQVCEAIVQPIRLTKMGKLTENYFKKMTETIFGFFAPKLKSKYQITKNDKVISCKLRNEFLCKM